MKLEVILTRVSLSLSLALGLPAVAQANDPPTPAAAGWVDPATDDSLVVHPLLTDEARNIVARHPELSVEEIYARLTVADEFVETKLGFGERRSVVIFDEAAPEVRFAEGTDRELPQFTVDEAVADWLSGLSKEDLVDVILVFDRGSWDQTVSVPHQQALAMLRGEVKTHADLYHVKQAVVAQREAEGTEAMSEALFEVERAGGEIVWASGALGQARVRVGLEALTALAESPTVVRMEAWSEGVEDAVGQSTTVNGPLDGIEIGDLLQSKPFYLWGYDGRTEVLGLTEPKDLRTDHHSFYGINGFLPRVFNCGGMTSTCSYIYSSSAFEHPTKVAGIMVSDLTKGQNYSGVPNNSVERERRSGIARDSFVFYMKFDGALLGKLAAYNMPLINQSANNDVGADCTGTSAGALVANAAYESGVAWINSAGNNANSHPTDCTVGATASAIGAFAVGAIRVEDPVGNPPFTSEDIHSGDEGSARGGTGNLLDPGAGRTIVALTSYTGHSLRAEATGLPGSYAAETHRFGITSSATPMVSGAAALYRDWYHAEQGALIEDPGILYANLLLMTDGLINQSVNALGTTLTETFEMNGFDGLYGAGRLRLRAFDSDGLDGPGGFTTGSICVPNGWTKVIQINQLNPVAADVDYLKFVTWTYDHGHGAGGVHDKFKIKASYQNSAGGWVEAASDSSNDNRHRVFVDEGVGGKAWRLEVTGVNVTSDDEGCGDNSNRVYYAAVHEENARDDDPNLTTYVRPEPAFGQ